MKTICIALLAICFAGCTTRTVEYQGVRYIHRSFGVKQNIGRLSIAVPNGPFITVDNFSNDQAQAIGVAVEKAVEAAVKSASPMP